VHSRITFYVYAKIGQIKGGGPHPLLNPPLVPTGGGPEPWHPADPLNPSLKLLQRRADECLDGSYLGEFYAYLQ